MRCYFTGDECDCDAGMDGECPHDDMVHDDEELTAAAALDDNLVELRFAAMSHQLER